MMRSMTVTVRQATIQDLPALVPLFDAYRQFYGVRSNNDTSLAFLLDRLERRESVILMAEDQNRAAGFVQIFPSFSSIRASRHGVLNDLYVAPDFRRSGIASRLLDAAAGYGRSMSIPVLSLSTAADNVVAQALYERKGWVRDDAFYTYHLSLEGSATPL